MTAALTETLERLGYVVIQAEGSIAVRGFGIAVAFADDETADEALARLAEPAAHRERCFQATEPEASAARRQLEQLGYAVTRPDPAADLFDVRPDAPPALPAHRAPAANSYAGVTAAQLPLVLEQVDAAPVDVPPAADVVSGP